MTNFINKVKSLFSHNPLTKEKREIEKELEIAKIIQSNMLPRAFSVLVQKRGFDIYATMKPAKKVGGDFYDFFMVDKNKLAVIIADVSGKGIAAAMFMAMAKPLIKNQAMLGLSPKQVMNSVNKQLCKNNNVNMFITAFIGVLDLSTGELVYSNAGHTKPLIYKEELKKFVWLNTKPDFVLAGDGDTQYEQGKTILSYGDMLFLYTDGITEALNKKEEIFTDKRLIETLNHVNNDNINVKIVINTIKKEISAFSKGVKQSDDIAMLALKYCREKTKINYNNTLNL